MIALGVILAFVKWKPLKYALLPVGILLGWYFAPDLSFVLKTFLPFSILFAFPSSAQFTAILAIAFGMLLFLLTRFSVSVGLSLVAYYFLELAVLTYGAGSISFYVAILPFVIFVLSMILYKRFKGYIGPFLGGFLVYYATFYGFHLTMIESIGLWILLTVVGILVSRSIKDEKSQAPPTAQPL